MSTGTWHAKRNQKGKIVLEIRTEIGSSITVPNAGRVSDELVMLGCDGKAIEYKVGNDGTLVVAMHGDTVLFSSSNKTQQSRADHQAAASQPASQNVTVQPQRNLQTFSQRRAKHALAAIEGWASNNDASKQKELKSYVVGMPAMILMSGFGQTCAFYKSKGGNHEVVLKILQSWLSRGDLMKFITEKSAQEYQLAEAETLEYLNWLKKFAKAYLKDEKSLGDE